MFSIVRRYAPVIRALDPESKLVLHLHAEWFSQSNPALLARRLRHVDFVTTVSNYITEKTCRDFPQIASRCETAYNGITASEFRDEKDYQAAKQRRQKRILYAGAISPHKGLSMSWWTHSKSSPTAILTFISTLSACLATILSRRVSTETTGQDKKA